MVRKCVSGQEVARQASYVDFLDEIGTQHPGVKNGPPR